MTERKWYWAILLTLVQPGLGHMYAGRLARGVASWASLVALFTGMFLSRLPDTFQGLAVFTTVSLLAWLAILVDAVLQCRAGRFVPKSYNRWHWYLAVLAGGAVLGAVLFGTDLIGINYLQAFRTPSESMAATLLPGDNIYADMSFYHKSNPRPGDLVVMRYPKDPSLSYLKRVAAVPGDVVEINGDRMTVNGRDYDMYQYAPTGRSNAYMPSLKLTLSSTEYFVLGDNIEHSQDSRYFGPIKRRDILGKALYIYFSSDSSRVGRGLR